MDDKKYHFLYKTTNIINGKFYYGIHSTNNMNDLYLGSGIYLDCEVKKYGKENFKREILLKFKTRQDASLVERSIITREVVDNPQSYNMKVGGESSSLFIKQREGIERAKAQGKYKGRKSIITNELKAAIAFELKFTQNKTRICKKLKIGRATLYRALKMMDESKMNYKRYD